jgi:flagellar motor switch protein FliN
LQLKKAIKMKSEIGVTDERVDAVDAMSKKRTKPLITLDSEIFDDVDVALAAVLGHGTIAVRALLDLREGSVVNLETPLDGLVELTLNNRVVARGEIVAVDDHFGVRVTEILVQPA